MKRIKALLLALVMVLAVVIICTLTGCTQETNTGINASDEILDENVVGHEANVFDEVLTEYVVHVENGEDFSSNYGAYSYGEQSKYYTFSSFDVIGYIGELKIDDGSSSLKATWEYDFTTDTISERKEIIDNIISYLDATNLCRLQKDEYSLNSQFKRLEKEQAVLAAWQDYFGHECYLMVFEGLHQDYCIEIRIL